MSMEIKPDENTESVAEELPSPNLDFNEQVQSILVGDGVQSSNYPIPHVFKHHTRRKQEVPTGPTGGGDRD